MLPGKVSALFRFQISQVSLKFKMQPNPSVRIRSIMLGKGKDQIPVCSFLPSLMKMQKFCLKYLIKKCAWSPGKEESKGRKRVCFFFSFLSSGLLLIYSHLLYSFIPKENSPVLCQPACLNHSLIMLLNRKGESYINKGSKI